MLTVTEKEELAELRELTGWQHLVEPVRVSIDLKKSALLNFVFERDDETNLTKKSLLKYENIQRELVLLKEFFAYLNDGGIIEEVEDYEVFDKPKKIEKK